MTQHDTAVKLTDLILRDPANILTYVKQAYAIGFDLGRDRSNQPMPVIQLSLDGHLIEIHDSINQAAESLDITDAAIGRAAHGKLQKAGGYKWRF
jgi:hypothetical protein